MALNTNFMLRGAPKSFGPHLRVVQKPVRRFTGVGFQVGGCQNYGFLDPDYNTAPNI